jgi:heme a synthase
MADSTSRRLAWLAIAALALVMMLGNVVSATGSGLGCPDWPLCHGRFIPPGGTEIWIEFRHRLAVPLFSVLLVATAVLILRRAESRALRRIAIALLALLGVQILLGGITVKLGLSASVSTVHLLTALMILAGLLTICASTYPLGSPSAAPRQITDPLGSPSAAPRQITDPLGSPSAAPRQAMRLARLTRAGLATLLVQLALGGYVRHTGAGLACPDFPLCSGDLLPAGGSPLIHWIHRWLGVALLGLFLHLALASRRTALGGVGAAIGVLALIQVALGIAAVLLRLPVPVRATHAAGGYALWGLLVWMAVRAGVGRGRLRITDPLGSPPAAPRQTTDPLGSPPAAPRQSTAPSQGAR